MKLMIIDDHAGVRHLIRQLLATPSDVVCECACGSDAVPLARDFKPDYVTMDVRLPGLNGIEATRALCADHPGVRIVMVTAFDQAELRRSAAEAGAVGYVAKENLGELRAVLFGHRGMISPQDKNAAGADREGSIESP